MADLRSQVARLRRRWLRRCPQGLHPARPVIVLEQGAWADASSWSSVISRLQRRGFIVYAPPDPLRGLPQDSAYLHQFLTQNAALHGQPVVLVGHSYGGAVITNAAAGDPEVRALVYVDASPPACPPARPRSSRPPSGPHVGQTPTRRA
jgi:pimeloyl-ACP methyl ester carboxylesterase